MYNALLTFQMLNNKNKAKNKAELTIQHEDDFKRVKAVVLQNVKSATELFHYGAQANETRSGRQRHIAARAPGDNDDDLVE